MVVELLMAPGMPRPSWWINAMAASSETTVAERARVDRKTARRLRSGGAGGPGAWAGVRDGR